MPHFLHRNRKLTDAERHALAMESLKMTFAFGVPGGRSKIQRAIGRYWDGDNSALDGMPKIRAHFDKAATMAHAAMIGVMPVKAVGQ